MDKFGRAWDKMGQVKGGGDLFDYFGDVYRIKLSISRFASSSSTKDSEVV